MRFREDLSCYSFSDRLRFLAKPLEYKLMKFFVTRYVYLHKIDKIFINLDTREVQVLVNNKLIFPVEFSLRKIDLEAFFSKKNRVDEIIHKKILEIFKNRHDEERG